MNKRQKSIEEGILFIFHVQLIITIHSYNNIIINK